MGIFSSTAALLAALASGDARIVTQDDLRAVTQEIQAARATHAAQAAELAATRACLAAQQGALLAGSLQHQNSSWDVAQREADMLFAPSPVVALAKKETKISRHDLISTAVLIALFYGAKRCYNAYSAVKSENGAAPVGAVCKRTGLLVWQDIRMLLHVLTAGFAFKNNN